MPERSTTEAIYLLRRLKEKARTYKKDLHMVFIDLGKAYDRVPRDLIWQVLGKKEVSSKYVDILKDMHGDVVTSVRSVGGQGVEFSINIGLHQGSALSPYLFTLLMNELTRNIQGEVPWCMLFVDDIVLISETVPEINVKLELWRYTLESRGLKISRTKTEYMKCNFSRLKIDSEEVKIEAREIPQCNCFRYLSSTLNK
ncbi:uncharacterized protein LOC122068611 [Macadamia integrifolia]|uniref:uncharacterized protein LOC122068611 n=1 Tax=Macadamia integrifolia TaxID=60698 RepID=UPI001C4F6878|nr:uncharacterized protein LOC122068611 [Macadamia integrifolia]